MNNDCSICPFIASQSTGDKELLLQTQHWNVVLDKNQEYLGKSFVTSRTHRETISDLDESEWRDLHVVMKRVELAVKAAFGADVLNWSCLMNNAIAAGTPTHVHWHLHPRFLNGGKFAGEEFPDEKWPRRREKQERFVSDELFSEIADAIREKL